ncbi:MAG: GTP-binding protein [Cyclobacteriaceae bacterium]
MEAIITIVGFLGAGKTTLLKYLTDSFIKNGWNPFIILNDYENAYLDTQQLTKQTNPNWVKPLNGSCICCSGINELRNFVNNIPERENGITLIEANGTSDACSLMGFLGVGLDGRFLPPIQVSVVDVKNWQKRDNHNELEANQIQVSSLIVLTHANEIPEERVSFVRRDIKRFNPFAEIITTEELDVSLLPKLTPSKNKIQAFDHKKAHWSSCSIDLPKLSNIACVYAICNALPTSILRVKGCAQIDTEEHYTYFERLPDGTVNTRLFNGEPITGSKLLTIGPGSDVKQLEEIVQSSIKINLVSH